MDLRTPTTKTNPTPEDLRKSISGTRSISGGPSTVKQSLQPFIERDNLQRIANETGKTQTSANGSPILPYLGTKERTNVWLRDNGQIQVLKVNTPVRSLNASATPFDPKVPGSIRKAMEEFDELMDTHDEVNKVNVEPNEVFMEDGTEIGFSPDTSVDSITRINQREEKQAAQPAESVQKKEERKKANPGRPSKLQEAGRKNNNSVSNYLTVPPRKSTSISPMSTPGTPKRKPSDEAVAEETKKKKEDLSNKEKVIVTPREGDGTTKKLSGIDPEKDSTISTEQVAGITPLQENVSRRTMENVTADLNSTDTNLDQKYLSGTLMGDLIDYPINDNDIDISVSGSNSDSQVEDISSSSSSDDEDCREPAEIIEEIFKAKGYQLIMKKDKFIILDPKEAEELLSSRLSEKHVFASLGSVKGRMKDYVQKLVCERAVKDGGPGADKILRQAVERKRRDSKYIKKLDKYWKQKDKISNKILEEKEVNNKRSVEKAKQNLKQSMKKSYDREADRKANTNVALSKQMVEAYDHLGRSRAEDKEEPQKKAPDSHP